MAHDETLNVAAYVAEGKRAWAAMLRFVAELHGRSAHPAKVPFDYAWEEIGPGYIYGPAFGHWDIVHQMLDVVFWDRAHVRRQLLNDLKNQQPDGFLPGSIWMRDQPMEWHRDQKDDGKSYRWNQASHPSVWPAAVDALLAAGEPAGTWLPAAVTAALRQLEWFETSRRAEPAGYFYTDVRDRSWESGVDEGIRFDQAPQGEHACIDATCHAYMLADGLSRWDGVPADGRAAAQSKSETLRRFVRDELYSDETGLFHDHWSARNPARRPLALEGIWPVVVGIATPAQADTVIEGNLMNPRRFLTAHPPATVAVEDPGFELRMWRGASWNSMTLWAVLGCIRYGHCEAARRLAEAALDGTARQFERTGTVWEFYHPHGGNPETVERKPVSRYHAPCRDYLGHNPVLALARLHERLATGMKGDPLALLAGSGAPRQAGMP